MKRRTIWYLVFCSSLLLSLLLIWIVYSLFMVRKVVVISASDEFNGLNILDKKNLLFLDENKIASFLLSQNKIYLNLSVRKKYPNILLIDTKLRVPVAFLINKGRKIFIDQEGIYIPNLNIAGNIYTEIEVPNLLILNLDNIDWRVLKAVKLVLAGSKNSLTIVKIVLDEPTGLYHLFLSGGEEAVSSQEQDPYLIAASLQIIISRFRIEGKIISQIKFQYDKPVVVLKSGEKITSI